MRMLGFMERVVMSNIPFVYVITFNIGIILQRNTSWATSPFLGKFFLFMIFNENRSIRVCLVLRIRPTSVLETMLVTNITNILHNVHFFVTRIIEGMQISSHAKSLFMSVFSIEILD